MADDRYPDDQRTDLPHDQMADDETDRLREDFESGFEEYEDHSIDELNGPDAPEEFVEPNLEPPAVPEEMLEETATEVAPDTRTNSFRMDERSIEQTADDANTEEQKFEQDAAGVREGRTALGWSGIVLSIFSLFFLPVLLAAAGIVTGYFAYRGGARTLGLTAIGVGAFSLIIGLFFAPMFIT